MPREHGAVAMLLTPFFAAAVLLRRFYWTEIVALAAIVCAFAIKDPLVVIGRQRFVWKREHAETGRAGKSVLIGSLLLAASGLILVLGRDWRPFLPLFVGAALFTALAVIMNIRNRQRSEWFQAASAAALTATAFMACLAAEGSVPAWCWPLWLLSAMQAAAGIFVVHARLDARIASRKKQSPPAGNRRAAYVCQAVLIAAAIAYAATGHVLLSAGLLIAAAGYLCELRRQQSPVSLELPLTTIGVQALGLSVFFTLVIVAGLWNY